MAGALDGVRVVEFAGFGPTANAAMMLGDMGADVVRIEHPGSGLVSMGVEPDPVLRNRRAVSVDLKSGHGIASVRALIVGADVVVEGLGPGFAESLGVGPADCAALDPRVIYARLSGWGQGDTRSNRAGSAINVLSVTGALFGPGQRGDRSVPTYDPRADLSAASMLLVTGIVAALFERERSGLGQVVETSLADSATNSLQAMSSPTIQPGRESVRSGVGCSADAPFHGIYKCQDGHYVAVGAVKPRFYAELLVGLGLDEQVLPPQMDRSGWPTLRNRFSSMFASRSREYWAKTFAETDACVTPVLSMQEATDSFVCGENSSPLTTVDGLVQSAPSPRFSRTVSSFRASQQSELHDIYAIGQEWSEVR